MNIPVWSTEQLIQSVKNDLRRDEVNYFAMYSSWFGAIITDTSWMSVPIDDHLVHRGDGVFEAMRVDEGAVYDLKSHLDRLERSAAAIQLEIPLSRSELERTILKTAQVANQRQALIRLYVSRGPGGFSTNPQESKPQCYIVITSLKTPRESLYTEGATAKFAEVEMKRAPWAQIKSCNYLQNVLMKWEALEAGVDFTLSVSPTGELGEGSTENFALLLNNELLAPPLDNTLRGTTMMRVFDLAEQNKKALGIKRIGFQTLTKDDLKRCQECFFIGTTTEVAPVIRFGSEAVGEGAVGLVAKELRKLLKSDIAENSEVRTAFLEVESPI